MARDSRLRTRPLSTAILVLALALPTIANAQYIYLDADGDGVHTVADTLGVDPVRVSAYLITGHNRDGSEVFCSQGPESLTLGGYTVLLSGAVRFSNFTNEIPSIPTSMYWISWDSQDCWVPTDSTAGFVGIETVSPPTLFLPAGGPYKLFSVTVTPTTNHSEVGFVPLVNLHAGCPPQANLFVASMFLTGCGSMPNGSPPSEWTAMLWADEDGLRYPAPPILTAPLTVSGNEGQPIQFAVTAASADGYPIASLNADPLPPGATFSISADNTSGTFNWTPGPGQAGPYSVTFTATGYLTASATTAITVGDSDWPPVVDAPPYRTVEEGELLSFFVYATDPDGEQIETWSTGPLPSGANFSGIPSLGAAEFNWTPGCGQTGAYDVTFYASNSKTGSATVVIQVSVRIDGDWDGDGLLDFWETYGVPINGDGTYVLPGADPCHKDVYVELDAMTGVPQPADDMLLDIVRAFNTPQVTNNPDGRPGITLHFCGQNGEGTIDERDVPKRDWTSGSYDAICDSLYHMRDSYFGTPDERGSWNWSDIRDAKLKAFHYGAVVDNITAQDNTGIACDWRYPYGPDFIVTLNGSLFGLGGVSRDKFTGTIMHELGHTLGLRHGGGDGVEWKPNYYSVMNYLWQWQSKLAGTAGTVEDPNKTYHDSWRLDYSGEEAPSINENNLNEQVGMQLPYPGRTAPAGPLVWDWSSLPPTYHGQLVPMSGPVDWNRDGDFTDTQFGEKVRISGPDSRQVLTGFDDWAYLASRPLAPARGGLLVAARSTTGDSLREIDREIYQFLDSLAYDCNSNGVDDRVDLTSGQSLDNNGNGIPDECEQTSIVSVEVSDAPRPSKISLFPSPIAKSGVLHLVTNLESDGVATVEIADVQGRIVRRQGGLRIPRGRQDLSVRPLDTGGRGLPAGVYFARIRVQGSVLVRKFVIVD